MRGLISLVCLFAVVVSALKIYLGVPLPFVDIFLFKEAGARLALDGVFAVRNLPHMEHDQLTTYAYSVPIYPLCYGLWASCFGVNLSSSIAFDQTIKLIRTLLFLVWIWPHVGERIAKHRGVRIAFTVTLCALTLLPFHSDRPDDLALAFGILGLILPLGYRGVVWGLVAATSPAAAVLFGALYVSEMERSRDLGKFLFSGLGSFLVLIAPVLIADGHAPARFLQQVPLSVRPLISTDWSIFVKEWQKTFWYAGKELTIPIICFGFVLLIRLQISKMNSQTVRVAAIALGFAVLSTILWTYQPRYLWFSYLLLFGTAWPLLVRYSIAQIGLCLFPIMALVPEGKALSQAMKMNRSRDVGRQIESVVGPESRLAISADHYFTFRNRREIDLAHYVCRSLDKYDFIFLSRATLSERVEPPCRGKRRHFEVALDLGEAGVLFRRKPVPEHRFIASTVKVIESTRQ